VDVVGDRLAAHRQVRTCPVQLVEASGALSGSREVRFQCPRRPCRGIRIERSRRRDPFRRPLRPQHLDVVDQKIDAEKRPVRLDEAQHPENRDVGEAGRLQCGLDQAHLTVDAADELGAVARSHHESFAARFEEAAADAQARRSRVALRVDHEHAARADRDVVDVGLSARDAAVVQDLHALLSQRVQPATEDRLAARALLPRRDALGLVAEGEKDAAEARMVLADALLAPVAEQLVAALGGGAGDAAVEGAGGGGGGVFAEAESSSDTFQTRGAFEGRRQTANGGMLGFLFAAGLVAAAGPV
jgi:hypothetical protein